MTDGAWADFEQSGETFQGHIVGLDIRRRFDWATSVEVALAASPSEGAETQRFLFEGVRDLTFDGQPGIWSLCLLRVSDIRDHQLEGVRFKVWDEESDTLSLTCLSWRRL
jgi:hypothetical protein